MGTNLASSYIVHLWKIGSDDRAYGLIKLAEQWARQNQGKLRSVQNMDWKAHHTGNWEHVRGEAHEMVASAVGEGQVEWAIELVEGLLKKRGTIQ